MRYLYPGILALTLITAPFAGTDLHAQSPCGASDQLATPYDSDNGLDGVMFDVTAQQLLTVNCFEINWSEGTADIAIYYMAGTHADHEEDASAWTQIGTAVDVVSAAQDEPTYIPLNVNVTIPAGETYAFYITAVNDADPTAKYTDGDDFGAVFASDANLSIREGTGVAYPFGFNLNPRKANCTVNYTLGPAGVTEAARVDLITMRPNPARDRVELDLTNTPGQHPIDLTDASGRVLLHRTVTGGRVTSLDLGGLSEGVYFLTVRSGEAPRTFRLVHE